MVGTKELPCIKCKSVRNVQLGDEKDPKGGSIKHGIAYLMDTAADVLPRVSKQPVEGPMAANMASLGGKSILSAYRP